MVLEIPEGVWSIRNEWSRKGGDVAIEWPEVGVTEKRQEEWVIKC